MNLLDHYFLQQTLSVEKIFNNGDAQQFKLIIEAMIEMIWLTNNFLAHF